MSTVTQTLTGSYTPPAAAGARLVANSALAKQKIAGWLAPPPAAAPGLDYASFYRRLAGASTWTLLKDLVDLPDPVTNSGVTFAQMPVRGLARNLVVDGACQTTFGKDLHATAAIVVDAASPTGYALKQIASATLQNTNVDVAVVAGRAYSYGAQAMGDGTNAAEVSLEWLTSAKASISVETTLTRTTATYGELKSENVTAPGTARYARFRIRSAAATGIAFWTALRFIESATLPAWTAAHNTLVGSAGAVFTAAAGNLRLLIPAGFVNGSWSATIVYAPTTSPHAANVTLLLLSIDANNYWQLIHTTGGVFQFVMVRAGVTQGTASVTPGSPAAGDTYGITVTQSSAGIFIELYKNGAALQSNSVVTIAAQTPPLGTLTAAWVGSNAGASWADGVFGIVRYLAGGLSQATQQAYALDPYQDIVDGELAVWRFEEVIYLVPVFDDQIAPLGTACEWKIDVTSVGPDIATAFGAAFPGTIVAARDAFWLKDPATAANNLRLPVAYDAGIPFARPRRAQTLQPLAGSTKTVLYGVTSYGDEFTLALKFATASELNSVEAALKRLLALDSAVYYQDRRGGVRKVRFPQGLSFVYQDYELLEAEVALVEVT